MFIQVCKMWHKVFKICLKERRRYDSHSFYWEGKCADVSYYSKYRLFESPHHRQLYGRLEAFMAELPIKPRIAVIFGSGDSEIRWSLGDGQSSTPCSVRDSSPGQDPEDHMERSWLVDKAGVGAQRWSLCAVRWWAACPGAARPSAPPAAA
jgi:hypothetical protein